MNQLKPYLSLKVWSAANVVSMLLAVLILLAIPSLAPAGLFSQSGAIAGATGGLVLYHLGLHGWTLLKGTFAQRALLAMIWFAAVLTGGALATLIYG